MKKIINISNINLNSSNKVDMLYKNDKVDTFL